MIINIRGNSGSGKTTLVRNFMHEVGVAGRIKVDGRKNPLAYVLKGGSIAVLGSYENACGGCDTIMGTDEWFRLMREMNGRWPYVIAEGLLLSEERGRSLELGKDLGDQFRVIGLTTSLEDCIASINDRRRAKKADAPPVDEENIRRRQGKITKTLDILSAGGVTVMLADRPNAASLLRSWTHA